MEVLKFIFSSVWVFLGTLILISCILDGLANIIFYLNSKKLYQKILKELGDVKNDKNG